MGKQTDKIKIGKDKTFKEPYAEIDGAYAYFNSGVKLKKEKGYKSKRKILRITYNGTYIGSIYPKE